MRLNYPDMELFAYFSVTGDFIPDVILGIADKCLESTVHLLESFCISDLSKVNLP